MTGGDEKAGRGGSNGGEREKVESGRGKEGGSEGQLQGGGCGVGGAGCVCVYVHRAVVAAASGKLEAMIRFAEAQQAQAQAQEQAQSHSQSHSQPHSPANPGPLVLSLDPASGMTEDLLRDLVWFAYTGTLTPPVLPSLPSRECLCVSTAGLRPVLFAVDEGGVEAVGEVVKGVGNDVEREVVREVEKEVEKEVEREVVKEVEKEAESEAEKEAANKVEKEGDSDAFREVERLLGLLWLADEYLSPALVRACSRRLLQCLGSARGGHRGVIAGETQTRAPPALLLLFSCSFLPFPLLLQFFFLFLPEMRDGWSGGRSLGVVLGSSLWEAVCR